MSENQTENDYTEDELRELFSFTDGGKTWPFFESEDAEIVGYGHQDKATFAAAVNEYDEHMTGEIQEPGHDHREVSYRYVVINRPSECEDDYWTYTWGYLVPGQSRPEPYTADHPGVVPVTGIWGVR